MEKVSLFTTRDGINRNGEAGWKSLYLYRGLYKELAFPLTLFLEISDGCYIFHSLESTSKDNIGMSSTCVR